MWTQIPRRPRLVPRLTRSYLSLCVLTGSPQWVNTVPSSPTDRRFPSYSMVRINTLLYK